MSDVNTDLPANQFDYGPVLERPYQCFMGRWEGLCKTFSAGGDFLEASAVH